MMKVTQLPDNSINEKIEIEEQDYHLVWWNKGINDDDMYTKYELYFDNLNIDVGLGGRCFDNTLKTIQSNIDSGYYNMDILYNQLELLQSGLTDVLKDKSVDEIKQFSGLTSDRVNELKSYCYSD